MEPTELFTPAGPSPRLLASRRVSRCSSTFVLFLALYAAGSSQYDSFFSIQVLFNLFVDNAYLLVSRSA